MRFGKVVQADGRWHRSALPDQHVPVYRRQDKGSALNIHPEACSPKRSFGAMSCVQAMSTPFNPSKQGHTTVDGQTALNSLSRTPYPKVQC